MKLVYRFGGSCTSNVLARQNLYQLHLQLEISSQNIKDTGLQLPVAGLDQADVHTRLDGVLLATEFQLLVGIPHILSTLGTAANNGHLNLPA